MAASAKGKAGKPSKVVKAQKRKASTPHSRNHRFQSFSERIAKIKIDPIRRRRNAEGSEELGEDTATYFGKSLEEWKDINLSQTFTSFVREATPLCDSLPVVLHNENKIMGLLITYIEKGDGLALEPLLGLLSNFAHDLDSRFERHFQRAVAAVTAVAARAQDPAVIEWSFSCLAWLFKYLSRLLTPDLRPLYDLMSPYLGKETQKPFIIRFAAESMSFLVRKAATMFERDPAPLHTIVEHMLQDWQESQGPRCTDLYSQGLMTLLTEAMKGVQNGLHSGGINVLKSLLFQASETPTAASDIVAGTMTSLIHHTTSKTFAPALEATLAWIREMSSRDDNAVHSIVAQTLFVVVSVRKGTRISDWKPVLEAIHAILEHHATSEVLSDASRFGYLTALAVAMQTCPLNAILPQVGMFETIQTGSWGQHYLRFCDIFSRLGSERFQQFLIEPCLAFVTAHWHEDAQISILYLPAFATRGTKGRLTCPPPLQNEILSTLSAVSDRSQTSDQLLWYANAIIDASKRLISSPDMEVRQRTELLSFIATAHGDRHDRESFAFGNGLSYLLSLSKARDFELNLWQDLCMKSTHCLELPLFWRNVRSYLDTTQNLSVPEDSIDTLKENLVNCLSSPSHETRESALETMQLLYEQREEKAPMVLVTAVQIETTPISLDTSRSISMSIRRLASSYTSDDLDPWMRKAIPAYCFGLLHLKLSQAWEDAAQALVEISKHQDGGQAIAQLAEQWLLGAEDVEDQTSLTTLILDHLADGFQAPSDFECTNLARMTAISNQVFDDPTSGYPSFEMQFRTDNQRVKRITPSARGQALRVLNKLPVIAEKHNRMLVPVLLHWAGEEEASDELSTQRWSRKDQKAMLSVFEQFTNPKVLFKSDEVFSALLQLCANGDAEIQRSALKALYAWKDPAINRYREHLDNLLDESRFREEVSVFLQSEAEDDAIHLEDQPHLMPVLLRLLYGRAVAGGKTGQHSRRKAMFVALSRFGPETLGMFVEIATSSAGRRRVFENGDVCQKSLDGLTAPLRQQLGMLNMLHDMVDTLGSDLEPFAEHILDAVMVCVVRANKTLLGSKRAPDTEDGALLRSVRQSGLQCLHQLFANIGGTQCSAYAKLLIAELVVPKSETFAAENAQSVSAMLRIFAAWSASADKANFLAGADYVVLHCLADLLGTPSAKDEVRLFVLNEILINLLGEGRDDTVLQPYVSSFVRSISHVLKIEPSRDVLDACVRAISQLATRITTPDEIKELVRVCAVLLRKPSKVVPQGTKTGLLRTLLPLLETIDGIDETELWQTISVLFSRLYDVESRSLLASVLLKLSGRNKDLLEIAGVCEDMNALGRMSEPDHERRERAFSSIYARHSQMTLAQWQPVVHNCLFFIRDADDIVNRSSASRALELFVQAVKDHQDEMLPFLSSTFYPGLERGMKEQSELVRAEYLRLLHVVVEALPAWAPVADLTALIVGGDEEASVFTNVLHIQQHRRLRALRRLAEDANQLGSSNISRVMIPLLEHFIFDQPEGDAGRTLADQTIEALGALARSMNWSAFRATMKRYLGETKKEELEKPMFRLVGVFADALYSGTRPESVADSHEPTSDEILLSNGFKKQTTTKLASTLPSPDLLQSAITNDFLPRLTSYLHRSDESTVDKRIPVATTVVKLLLSLPNRGDFATQLAPPLTDLCHILRSRAVEARDQTRRTLATIVTLIGPNYFGYLLKELRSSLQRGYQLHVLSYTVHSLLVSSEHAFKAGDVDEVLPELVSVVMDDTFGVSGQEKDAEEYKSTMKEIKSSKSYDTMEILAKTCSIARVMELVKPIQSLLMERLDSKSVKKIDDLLIRIRKGLDQNPAANDQLLLVLCYQVIRNAHATATTKSTGPKDGRMRHNRYLIAPEKKAGAKAAPTTSYSFKLVSFALNLVRKIVRRHEELLSPANMAGFLPIAGDVLVEGHEETKVAAMRFLTTVIRVQLADIDKNAPVYAREAVATIRGATSTTSDSSKAALELLTAVLRDRRSVTIRDRDLAQVLAALRADIDEPDRQGIVYKFLRSVLGRKVDAPEVYDVMDEVGRAMVTNPDYQIRESARGAYLQFVMDYPQAKKRWQKQINFLIQNLDYEHRSGRRSVLEMLHSLLGKLGDDVLEPLTLPLFVPLMLRLVNDEDGSCRDMAFILIGKLFERADPAGMKQILAAMRKWLSDEKPVTTLAALEGWKILLTKGLCSNKDAHETLETIATVLDAQLAEDFGDRQLRVITSALSVVASACDCTPSEALSGFTQPLWTCIERYQVVGDMEIKRLSAQLIGRLCNDFASTSSKLGNTLATLPLRGSGGLVLRAEDMQRMTAVSLRSLKSSEEADENLAAQIVRNLVFLGRCFIASNLEWTRQHSDGQDQDQNEDREAETIEQVDSTALAYLLRRLSGLIRHESLAALTRQAALQCQAALLHLTPEIPNLQPIIQPLYVLTDPSIPQPPGDEHKALSDKAREVLELVQKRVGSEVYVAALASARKSIQSRRDERRQKRRIEAVSAPEKWAKEKRKKYDNKKAKQKAKGAEARGRRRGW